MVSIVEIELPGPILPFLPVTVRGVTSIPERIGVDVPRPCIVVRMAAIYGEGFRYGKSPILA